MTTLTVSVALDDTTEIRVQRDRGFPAELHIGDDVWVRIEYGADEVAVADSLLAAMTEWHGEIHRRAAERAEAKPAWGGGYDALPCPAGEPGHDFSVGGRPGGSLHP